MSLRYFTVLLCLKLIHTAKSQYECGPHGKFEYCVDGVSGCVIGCHCHPGYFFDTDSKICESNMKLSQIYRRHDLPEPTRVFSQTMPTSEHSTTTAKSAVDAKIDEMTNDADELGDWLYNQFFKTIENQVINKTNDGDDIQLTRRSGTNNKSPSRKSNKRRKARKKKKPKKKKGLRNKLLRITEDDSLFDSSSGSSSSEESSSSETSESEETPKDKSDHGHKKILIFNKKPKPPLPSFIFLPNMETPYYPPIGLPPPAAVPMYPMVPVPPVMGPMYPYQAVMPKQEPSNGQPAATCNPAPDTGGASTTVETPAASATTETTTTTTTTLSSVPVETAPDAIPDVVSELVEEPATEAPPPPASEVPALRHRSRNRSKGATGSKQPQEHRNKFLQRLREKMKKNNKMDDLFGEQNFDEFPQLPGAKPSSMVEKPPTFPDVDFKYLTELIHKRNINDTKRVPPIPNSDNDMARLWDEKLLNRIDINRRHFYDQLNQNNPQANVNSHRSNLNEMSDSYYTNLGRQIASVIRKIDTAADRQVDVEIERSAFKNLDHLVSNENNNTPKTYWERSVRSPLQNTEIYNKELSYLKQSNEDLYKLENAVETVTSTKPYSLQDLEAIIYKMKKKRPNRVRKPPKPGREISVIKITPTKLTFDINLLPKFNESESHRITNSKLETHKPNKADPNKYYTYRRSVPVSSSNNNFISDHFEKRPQFIHNFTKQGTIYGMHPSFKPKSSPHNMPNTRSVAYQSAPMYPKTNMKSVTTASNALNSRNYNYNYDNFNNDRFNYYINKKNQRLSGNAYNPFHFPIFTNKNTQSPVQTKSYFHHELHHFDYFDNWKK